MENLKEYLRKNSDGEYILEVTNEREAQEPHAKHWIEVPKGCDYLISVFGVNSFIEKSMIHKIKSNKSFKSVLWQRDKEEGMKEYLVPQGNEKYALTKATEKRGSDWVEIPPKANFAYFLGFPNLQFTALEMGYRDAIVVWKRHTHPEELPFIDDEPLQSLNDQYAEIETVRQTLSQRQEQYGSFEDVAMITEQMVDVMRKGYYENLAYNQKMALYMICSKMARIVNGNPNHKDSWHDIAGYATLIDNELVSEKDMPF